MHGAWRNENGTPLNKVKERAPNWYARQLANWEQSEVSRKAQVKREEVDDYQAKRRERITLGRDPMGGQALKPRRVCQDADDDFAKTFGRRYKKPTTIVPEGTALFEAAEDGVVGEPDTKKGLEDWDKYKEEEEHGKKRYQRVIHPDD